MKWFQALAILAAISLEACQPPESKPPAAADPSGAGAAADPGLAASVAVPAYNLGDVEVATIPTVSLSGRSSSQYTEYMELRNPLTKSLANAIATVHSPLPSEFWVTTAIGSSRGFRDTDTVLARVSLKLDTQKEPIATKAYVWSGKTLAKHSETFEIDLMPFLKPTPESVMVQAWVKIVWFPDTDPATITPETADDSKGESVEKLSNPFRIDFK